MKKFIVIMLIAFVAIGAIFADDVKRWNVGASFGTASMVERTFNKDEVSKKTSSLGIGVDVRGDYQLVEDVYLTGVVGWEMPDRTFLVGDNNPFNITEGKQNYITALFGITVGNLDVKNTNDEVELIWSGTFAPEMWINVNKGKVGFGATGILKGACLISDNVSLDLSAKISVIGIKDSPSDNNIHCFTDMGIKLGSTYRF